MKGIGAAALLLLVVAPFVVSGSLLLTLTELTIFALFAASLHFMMGPGGMVSFGHAAYYGLGAYGAALAVKWLGVGMEPALFFAPFLAGLAGVVFGWFVVRLSGVYLAMLTLAFAQIVWSILFQWEDVTGGSNGILGIWPRSPFDSRPAFYLLTLALVVAGVLLLRRFLFAPFGYAMRAGRDSALRAEAIGINVRRVHWIGFAIAGAFAGAAGGLFAFAKGTISPDVAWVSRSIDAMDASRLSRSTGTNPPATMTAPSTGSLVSSALNSTCSRLCRHWNSTGGSTLLS